MYSYQTSTQANPSYAEQEQLSMSGGEGRRRSQSKNVMPISVRMIMQHHEEDGPLQVCGVEVGMVVMVVQIRQVMKGDTNIAYLVEDDTGRMEAVHYHDESTVAAIANTFVKIIGVLKTGREQNMVTIYRLKSASALYSLTSSTGYKLTTLFNILCIFSLIHFYMSLIQWKCGLSCCSY